ncbi:MAG: polysaccharide deacetylase [Phenylobacterium sp.]|nr:polysaccharide deacetylase [Phenylobacterium sp.]
MDQRLDLNRNGAGARSSQPSGRFERVLDGFPPANGPYFRLGLEFGLPMVTRLSASSGRLAILMYHAVIRDPLPVPDWCFLAEPHFRRHMEFIRAHCTVLPLAEALDRLQAGELQGPTVAITFDDGFQNVHDVAFPILRELGLPATTFLCTALVDGDDTLWFCRLNQAVTATRSTSLCWRGHDFDLADARARARSLVTLKALLKVLPHNELLDEVRGIVSDLVDSAAVAEVAAPFRILDTESIRSMVASGLMEFGGHTLHHPIISRLPDDQLRTEILQSIHDTEALTGRPCRLFAYPNGDYDARAIEILRSAGVTAAVTTLKGLNTAATPALELRRVGAGPFASPAAIGRRVLRSVQRAVVAR